MESPPRWWRQCILATCRGRAERPKSPTGGLSSAPEFGPRPPISFPSLAPPHADTPRPRGQDDSRTYPCPIRSYDHVLIWNAIDLERKLEEFRIYYNENRVHQSLSGHTPGERSGKPLPAHAVLDHYAWRYHCRGLFQMPIAA